MAPPLAMVIVKTANWPGMALVVPLVVTSAESAAAGLIVNVAEMIGGNAPPLAVMVKLPVELIVRLLKVALPPLALTVVVKLPDPETAAVQCQRDGRGIAGDQVSELIFDAHNDRRQKNSGKAAVGWNRGEHQLSGGGGNNRYRNALGAGSVDTGDGAPLLCCRR